MIFSIGKSGYNIRYRSECILKIQINQHSLLTRKVFSWHSSSVKFFVTGSFIKFGSSSSLDHDQSRIIMKDGSSLDHHHNHCSYYLNQMVLSLNSSHHKKFYRDSPFSCFFRPSLHVGLHQQSHSFFMLDVLPFPYKKFPKRATSFSF